MRLSRLNFQAIRPNLVSSLFQPLTVSPKDAKEAENVDQSKNLSKSLKLMLDMGIVRQSQNGLYHVLPLGVKAMSKLKNIVGSHMRKLGAQEISIPLLVDVALWKKSGRWDKVDDEVFRLKDRHGKELVLNPTHEESVAALMASLPQLSHHQLPVHLYQMSTKFRDEIRPRCGLVRSREFVMKDLYSFDVSLEKAQITYDQVSAAYFNVITDLQLEAIKVEADPGDIGGLQSHEFHISCDIGNDTLYLCSSCSLAAYDAFDTCPSCKHSNIRKITSLEVGHTFLLGERYTKPLEAYYVNENNESKPLIMSCFGLGLSRILAACIESMSSDNAINWPYVIAPYKIVIIPAKEGSKEYTTSMKIMAELYETLNHLPHLNDDIIIDDRSRWTIGKRVVHSQKTGYPYILVVGRKCLQDPPEIEIIEQAPNSAPFTHSLSIPELIDYFMRRALVTTSAESVKVKV